MIEQAGTTLVFLPTYSPDFSPIEQAFSKLRAANAEPLATSSATDAFHWLWNAGDHPHEQPLCESLSRDFRSRDGDDSRDPSSRTYVALHAELAAE